MAFEPDKVEEEEPSAIKKAARTLMGPLGSAADLYEKGSKATDKLLYRAGGYVTDQLANVTPPEVAAAAGYLTNLGGQVATTFGGGGAVNATVTPMVENLGKKVMVNALKPSPAEMKSGKGMEAAMTLLQSGANPTMGGVAKIRGMIDELNTEIQALVEKSGAKIKVGDIGREVASKINEKAVQNLPEGDISALRTAWEQFKNNPLLGATKDAPVNAAQEVPAEIIQKLKQGTYRALGNKPYERMMNPAGVEAEMALARGERIALADAIPGLENANSKESKLLNALDLAERRALADWTKNPGGLAYLVHNPKMFAGYLASRSTAFKALLAQYLYHHADPEQAARAASAGLAMSSGSAPQQPQQ